MFLAKKYHLGFMTALKRIYEIAGRR